MFRVLSLTNLVLKNVLLTHDVIGSVNPPILLIAIAKFEFDMKDAMVFITRRMKPNVKNMEIP